MSIFNELILPGLQAIQNSYDRNIQLELQDALKYLEKLSQEQEQNLVGRGKKRLTTQKSRKRATTLQSIDEDTVIEDPSSSQDKLSSKSQVSIETLSSTTDNEATEPAAPSGYTRRASRKRSKDMVDGPTSPEQDKRQKRGASVRAQNNIAKQVNMNLTHKMRREEPGNSGEQARGKGDDDKENEPIMNGPISAKKIEQVVNGPVVVNIKQEKISIPPEPMETDIVPENVTLKKEMDDIAMPPPRAPMPRPRGRAASRKKELVQEIQTDSSDEEVTSKRRTKNKNQEEMPPPPPPVPAPRPTRATSRASSRANSSAVQSEDALTQEPRPKRTRAKKKADQEENENQSSTEQGSTSPPMKPRPKRTRRGKADKEEPPKVDETEKEPEKSSTNLTQNPAEKKLPNKQKPTEIPVLTKQKSKEKLLKKQDSTEKALNKQDSTKKAQSKQDSTEKALSKQDSIEKAVSKHDFTEKALSKQDSTEKAISNQDSTTKAQEKSQRQTPKEEVETSSPKLQNEKLTKTKRPKLAKIGKTSGKESKDLSLEDTMVLPVNTTVTISSDMDQTVVLPNGKFHHSSSPKVHKNMNETVVLETCNNDTYIARAMDCTVVLDRAPLPASNVTEDDSLLTNDSDGDVFTPPRTDKPAAQPTSAVKEKVQQFEELASRVTRTKTRAMAKKEEEPENQTPPDKVSKVVLSAETLSKMNSLIFNGKAPPVSSTTSSASKPRTNIVTSVKSLIPNSASKVTGATKFKEAAEQSREDARKKKEAILEAKKEEQRRKRENKMAAAAAAREAAERERQAMLEAAARERMEKQAHADQGKLDRLKEAEKKRQEQARKVAETEERRRAEEQARQQRLAEEQRKAEQARRKQHEESEATKREAALMAKEIEKRQKEYNEKQKLKQLKENKVCTPLKSNGFTHTVQMDPVYMKDGFEFLNSDDEDDDNKVKMPVPAWSTSKGRWPSLLAAAQIPSTHIDRLFSVRVHRPDLRQIFPRIDRRALKRTSSAVWNTPPHLHTLRE